MSIGVIVGTSLVVTTNLGDKSGILSASLFNSLSNNGNRLWSLNNLMNNDMSNLSDCSVDLDDLLVDLSDDSCEDNNLLSVDWSSWSWSRFKFFSKNVDLSVDNSDLLNVLMNLLGVSLDNSLLSVSQVSSWSPLRSWGWSGDSDNSLSNVSDLLGDSVNNSLQDSDLFQDSWLLGDRSSVILLLKGDNLSSDDSNLLGVLLDSLLENLNNLSLGNSWLWSWSWFFWQLLWILNSNDCSLDNIDLSGNSLNNLCKNSDLLEDDWLLRSWSRLILLSEDGDLLVDDVNLLDILGYLLGENLNDLLGNWSHRGWNLVNWIFSWFISSSGWSGDLSDDMSTGLPSSLKSSAGLLLLDTSFKNSLFETMIGTVITDLFPFSVTLSPLSSLTVTGLGEGGGFLSNNLWNRSWSWSWSDNDGRSSDWSTSGINRSWLDVLDSVDCSLNVNDLSDVLLKDSLQNSDLLLDDWLLFNRSSDVSSSEIDDLSSDDGNLLGQLSNLLDESIDDLLIGSSQWSSFWFRFWFCWSWISDGDDVSLDNGDLLDQLSNSLSQNSDLLEDNWLLLDWSRFVLLVKNIDLSVDDSNLLDVLIDSLSKLLDDSSFDLGQWLWKLVNWLDWFWVSDNSDNSLVVSDLLGNLSDNSGKNNNLLSDDWLLWSWSSFELGLQVSDGLSDDSDLLNVLVDLLGSLVDDNNLLLGNNWLRSWSDNLEYSMETGMSLSGNLSNFRLEFLVVFVQFFGEFFLKLSSDFSDLFLQIFNLRVVMITSLLQVSDNSLFNLGQFSNNLSVSNQLNNASWVNEDRSGSWSWSWSGQLNNSSLDVDNLLSDSLNNSSQDNDLSLDSWSFSNWSRLILGLEDSDLSLNDSDLLGVFSDLLNEFSNYNLFSLRWYEWLSFWSSFILWFRGWFSWSDDVMNSSLNDSNLSSVLSNNSLKNGDLLGDSWSFLLWSLDVLLSKNDDLSLDDIDLLDNLGNLFLVNLNDFLDFWKNNSFVMFWKWLNKDWTWGIINWFWSRQMSDSLSDMGNLSDDLSDSLLQNNNLSLDDWSLGNWGSW